VKVAELLLSETVRRAFSSSVSLALKGDAERSHTVV